MTKKIQMTHGDRAVLLMAIGFFLATPLLLATPQYAITAVSAGLLLTVWALMHTREHALQEALKEIERKNHEMEAWVERLGMASSQIISGDLQASLPSSPPEQIFRDLTENLEQMQAKLNQYFSNLLLKDRLSSLGVLASGIAHELNTPLTTMAFALHSENSLPKETKELLQGEIDRMGKITRDLLSFARPHPKEQFDLNEIIRKTEPLLKTADKKEIPISLSLSREEIPIVGASNEIQQVLFNLVHNSLDALEKSPGARIDITTERRPDGVAMLTVADNGCGIDSDNLRRILDPFFTTKSPGRGTGLGLFVVNQIVQKHDAVLTIDSEKGKGTKVRVLFLLEQKQRKEAA